MLQLLFAALILASPRSAPASAGVPADSVRADDDVRAAALRNAADVRRCYEREGLARDPKLRGLIEIAITILPTGQVQTVSVVDSSLKGDGKSAVSECVARAVRNWRFDRGPYGVETVIFPFNLAPVQAELEHTRPSSSN
jgi:outer membrane biosynthesis protein TonB